MRREEIEELTEKLNDIEEDVMTLEDVEGRISDLIEKMEREGKRNIYERGLYIIKGDFDGEYEIGVLVPMFLIEEGEVEVEEED